MDIPVEDILKGLEDITKTPKGKLEFLRAYHQTTIELLDNRLKSLEEDEDETEVEADLITTLIFLNLKNQAYSFAIHKFAREVMDLDEIETDHIMPEAPNKH